MCTDVDKADGEQVYSHGRARLYVAGAGTWRYVQPYLIFGDSCFKFGASDAYYWQNVSSIWMDSSRINEHGVLYLSSCDGLPVGHLACCFIDIDRMLCSLSTVVQTVYQIERPQRHSSHHLSVDLTHVHDRQVTIQNPGHAVASMCYISSASGTGRCHPVLLCCTSPQFLVNL